MAKNEKNNALAEELDSILDAIHDDILITDGKGFVLKVSKTFEELYGLSKADAIGRNVLDLQHDGYFKPSVTATVLKTGEQITMRQKNNRGRDLVITATPVKDAACGIKMVISYTRDVTELLNLEREYTNLENTMALYKEELSKLRNENLDVPGIIAKSMSMKKLLQVVSRVASFDTNVLLTGESGVGKSMLAKVIHNKSLRSTGPFIEINCGAIPENLLESELFGYEKGSFTGANKEGKVGLIEVAQNGTLFLDEISEMPINLQVKILKTIQDKCITRVGGTEVTYVDFRLIAASNKNLEKLVAEGLFREDLFYRLNVIPIAIPALRERKDDIVPMAIYFIEKFNEKYGMNKIISAAAFNVLENYPWPGNIRELENIVERMILTVEKDLIEINDLPGCVKEENVATDDCVGVTLDEAIQNLECGMVRNAYQQCGTTVGVARLLGVSQPTAVRKIQKYITKN